MTYVNNNPLYNSLNIYNYFDSDCSYGSTVTALNYFETPLHYYGYPNPTGGMVFFQKNNTNETYQAYDNIGSLLNEMNILNQISQWSIFYPFQ